MPLAVRGYEIVCVELGAGLAAVARRKLDRFSSVEVAIAPFETWPLPGRAFDAVISEYLDLLRTYSGHRALEPRAREGLLDCIGELIETDFGGRVTKRYLAELRIAARSS